MAVCVARVTTCLSRRLWRRPVGEPPRYLSASASTGKEVPTVETPTTAQLRIVALRYAIPVRDSLFVSLSFDSIFDLLRYGYSLSLRFFYLCHQMIGFGFMDNLVMISAGEAIDQTFGVAFGISTMTAAGFGQCFSDVAGNLSGGFVDAACARLNLPRHGLTEAQLGLKISRIYSTVGGCVGVVTGCLIGMSCLMFMDTDAADRAKRAKELQSVFEHVFTNGKTLFKAERASLFMLDEEKNELWSQIATGTGEKDVIKVKADSGIIGACVQSGELINVADAYEDKRFNPDVDKGTKFRTKSVLAIPVENEEGKIIGAIQMMNKKAKDGSDASFTSNEESLGRMMATHVTSFIRIVG